MALLFPPDWDTDQVRSIARKVALMAKKPPKKPTASVQKRPDAAGGKQTPANSLSNFDC